MDDERMKQAFERHFGYGWGSAGTDRKLTWQAAWRAATAAENEACAKIAANETGVSNAHLTGGMIAAKISQAIRARLAQTETHDEKS